MSLRALAPALSAFVFLLVAACGGDQQRTPSVLPAPDPSLTPTHLDSLAALTEVGTHAVDVYIDSTPNCPPCEGPEPCEPCGLMHTRLGVSDTPPGAGAAEPTYVDPAGLDTGAFRVGERYRLIVEVERYEDQATYVRLLGATSLAD